MDGKKIFEILKNDGVIAFVTDTVWGIGCLPTSETAVKRIYEIKKRDSKKPLILMSNDVKYMEKYFKPLNARAKGLIEKHFPGALTLVVEKSEITPDYVTSGMPTVGFRVPKNGIFSRICEYAPEHVLATTSANLSNEPAALTYAEALNYIGDKVDLVVQEEEERACGHASTVAGVFSEEIKIFRQGDVHIEL